MAHWPQQSKPWIKSTLGKAIKASRTLAAGLTGVFMTRPALEVWESHHRRSRQGGTPSVSVAVSVAVGKLAEKKDV